MKHLKTYESYLESNFQPLYHFTGGPKIMEILQEDILLGSRKKGDREFGVSTTRDANSNLGMGDIRLVLNQDRLRSNGYKIKPFDYLSISEPDNPDHLKYHKKFDIDRKFDNEYEEVVYGNIKPLGEYLISIDFRNRDNNYSLIHWFNLLEEYLEEYPHIILRSYKPHQKPIEYTLDEVQKMKEEFEENRKDKIRVKRKRRK